MNTTKEQPKKDGRVDPIDAVVAKRLFRRRCILGYSQRDLADAAGVSIQQIQKYEKSTNRISGGRLYQFAKFLSTPIEYFFDKVEEELDPKKPGKKSFSLAEDQAGFEKKTTEIADEKEVIGLVRFYNSIRDRNVRRKLLDLVRAIGSMADGCTR